MNKFMTEFLDIMYQIVLWFALVVAFFVGLFLAGFTFGIMSNFFMAGFRLL